MRNRTFRHRESSRELSVVVVEEEGELIGLVMDPSQPPVRIRLGKLQPPSFGPSCDCR